MPRCGLQYEVDFAEVTTAKVVEAFDALDASQPLDSYLEFMDNFEPTIPSAAILERFVGPE